MGQSEHVVVQSNAGMSELGDLLQNGQLGFWDAGVVSYSAT